MCSSLLLFLRLGLGQVIFFVLGLIRGMRYERLHQLSPRAEISLKPGHARGSIKRVWRKVLTPLRAPGVRNGTNTICNSSPCPLNSLQRVRTCRTHEVEGFPQNRRIVTLSSWRLQRGYQTILSFISLFVFAAQVAVLKNGKMIT